MLLTTAITAVNIINNLIILLHIIRPRHLHGVHLVIDVSHSMVCVSVCLLGTTVSYAKMAKPIEMPFGM